MWRESYAAGTDYIIAEDQVEFAERITGRTECDAMIIICAGTYALLCIFYGAGCSKPAHGQIPHLNLLPCQIYMYLAIKNKKIEI